MLSKVWSYQLSKGQCVYLNQQAPHGKHQNGQDNMNANQEVLWEECGTHELQQDMHQEKPASQGCQRNRKDSGVTIPDKLILGVLYW